jgi:hypothetical protein
MNNKEIYNNILLDKSEWNILFNDLNNAPKYNKNLIELLKTPLIFNK